MPLATTCLSRRYSASICEAYEKQVSVSYSQLTIHQLLGALSILSQAFFPISTRKFSENRNAKLPSTSTKSVNEGNPQHIKMSCAYLQEVFLAVTFDKTACRHSLYPEIVAQYPPP